MPRGALPFRIGREACPIFLGPKFCQDLYFLIYFFCLFTGLYFWVFTWLKTCIFWINLANNKEELNEKFQMDGFQGHFVFH